MQCTTKCVIYIYIHTQIVIFIYRSVVVQYIMKDVLPQTRTLDFPPLASEEGFALLLLALEAQETKTNQNRLIFPMGGS